MSIISSIIVEKAKQTDGRFYVTEHHTTDAGVVIPVTYLAEADDDHEVRMLARVAELEAFLVNEQQQANDQALLASAQAKVESHITTFTDQELKTTVGLTDAELVIFKQSLPK